MEYKQNVIDQGTYKDHTKLEKFILYKICYPVINRIGLNRPFNKIRHRLGFYSEYADGRCHYCGDKHAR